MKPVKRRIRKHYGLTAKQVAVRSHRPWYYRWLLGAIILASGYGVAYWQYAAGGQSVVEKLEQMTIANQNYETKVIQMGRQIQIEKASQEKLNKELNIKQDENNKLQEDLLFYKNMVGKK